MTPVKPFRHGLLTLLVLIIAGLAGCGYKTMPVPPSDIIPGPITDLRYELHEGGATLNWTYPAKTVKGDRLGEITSFKVYRAVVPADGYCETCPIPFGEPVMIEGGAITDKARTASYRAMLLRPGHIYFFKIRSSSGWWAESEDSNVISFMWDLPPAPPETLEAEVAGGKVTLRWSPVATYMDGTAISETVMYQVFRSRGDEAFAPVGELQAGVEYVDEQAAAKKTYRYKVQTVTMYAKGRVGGGISREVEVTTKSDTAPPAPEGVQGIRTAGGVKIIWDPVSAPGLKGYRIYRRLPDQSHAVLIGEVDAPNTIFTDDQLPEADNWHYSVTSIDNTQPANESKPSPEVKVRN